MKLSNEYVLNCFMDGLEEEIQWMVKMYKPQTLHEAYCLANVQELTLRTPKPKPSSELNKIEIIGEKDVRIIEGVVA